MNTGGSYIHNQFSISLILVLIFFSLTLSAQQLHTVKQDGTGDFTQIQAAIDFCQIGDTILVWPGIYYENLEISSKNITLGSLNLTTGDPAFIDQTVIDGNFNESCLKIVHNAIVRLVGFKITHGSGDTEYLKRGDGGGSFL